MNASELAFIAARALVRNARAAVQEEPSLRASHSAKKAVIPAQAGIQVDFDLPPKIKMDPSLRWDDGDVPIRGITRATDQIAAHIREC